MSHVIKCPFDAHVDSIVPRDGDDVVPGQVVIVLSSDDQARELARIETMREILGLAARRLETEHIERKQRMAEDAVYVARQNLRLKEHKLRLSEQRREVGVGTEIEVVQAKTEKAVAEIELRKSEHLHYMLDFSMSLDKGIDQVINTHIPKELAMVNKLIERRNIRTPLEGTFRSMVFTGQFVEVGDEICRVE